MELTTSICTKCGEDIVIAQKDDHVCFVQEAEKYARSFFVTMSDEQVARDQKIGTEYGTPLRPIADAVKNLMSSAHVAIPSKHKHSIMPSREDLDDARVFSIYRDLSQEVIDFFAESWVAIRLEYPPHKAAKFADFTRDFHIQVPEDMVELPVPPEGRNGKWTLAGYTKFKMPEDPAWLEMFDTIDPDPDPNAKKYRDNIRRSDDDKFGYISDTKLILTLLALRPETFKITSYPKLERRRGPRPC